MKPFARFYIKLGGLRSEIGRYRKATGGVVVLGADQGAHSIP